MATAVIISPSVGLSPDSSPAEVLEAIHEDVTALLANASQTVADIRAGKLFSVPKDAAALYAVLLRTEADLKAAQADLIGVLHGLPTP